MALGTDGRRRRRIAACRLGSPALRRLLAGLLCIPLAGHLPAEALPRGSDTSSPGVPCSARLAGLDASGETLFRTIALVQDRSGSVVTPLHTLERGGVRWERLIIEGEPAGGIGGATDVAAVDQVDPSADLVYLHAPGVPACTSEGLGDAGNGEVESSRRAWSRGTMVQVLRERNGYRRGAAGGRVERTVDMPDGRRLILARLLDAAGAEPGLLVDGAGALIGSVAPAPTGCDAALVVVVEAARVPAAGPRLEAKPRSVLIPRPSQSFLSTPAGLVVQALLLGGSGRPETALERLEAAMGPAGSTAPLLLERGALHYAVGRLPAAAADFRSASEADRSSYLARFNLGVVLGASGRYHDAADAFRQARDLDPSNPRTRFELALALRAGRQADAARGEWEALQHLDPTLARELGLLLGF